MRRLIHRRGFTLIELLVVVAIIALLVSILLPSLQRAKEQAKTAVCVANLKAVGTGLQSYAQRYNNTVLPLSFKIGNERIGWGNMLGELGLVDGLISDVEDPRRTDEERGSVLRCPSEIDKLDYGAPWGGRRTPEYRTDPARSYIQTQWRIGKNDRTEFYTHLSYGINGGNGLHNWGGRDLPHSRWGYENKDLMAYSRFQIQPADVIAVFDGYSAHISHADFVSARHNNQTTTNILACDGSAFSKKTNEVPYVGDPDENEEYRPQNYFKPK
jgi:prepilin-type N-terminal cleavage/methylation domain-containing protein